jgi:hypothetical protein
MLEISRRPGGTDKKGNQLPDIVVRQCNRCGATE